jgi:hypothetical protein
VHQVAAVENGHAGEIFHGAVHQIKVGAHAANTGVGVKAGQYRVGVRYLRQVGVIACHYAYYKREGNSAGRPPVRAKPAPPAG